MIFKGPQPLCRCCGKPIAKHTETISFVREITDYQQRTNGQYGHHYVVTPDPVLDKQHAQRFTNKKIVSVKRTRGTFFHEHAHEDQIQSVGIWDGQSYRDPFFCNRTQCAVAYAYMAVQSPNNKCVSVAYLDALHPQKQRKQA